jgi:AcrR family transcriptional regulator
MKSSGAVLRTEGASARQANVRQQKVLAVRARLATSALSAFAEHGYEATTIASIAKVAGVSTRTFFRHFATKEQVLFPESEARIERFRVALRQHRTATRGYRAIKAACLALALDMLPERQERALRQKIINGESSLRAKQASYIRELEKVLLAELTPPFADSREVLQASVMAKATIAVLEATLTAWYHEKCRSDLLEMGEFALSRLEIGFGSVRIPERTMQRSAQERNVPERRDSKKPSDPVASTNVDEKAPRSSKRLR